jgi:O-antigen ligase
MQYFAFLWREIKMLKIKEQNNKNNVSWLIVISLAILFLALMLLAPSQPWLLLIIPVIAIFVFLLGKMEYGLYLMAFFLPVIGWNFYFVSIKNFEIPFIDLLALTVFIAFFLKNIYLLFFDREKLRLRFSLLIPFLFFFASVTISNLLSDNIYANFWYSIRNILFFYLIYLVMPVNLIKNEKILKNTLLCFVASGVVTAIMGALSLFGQDWHYQFVRFIPLQIFGVYPIGDNHNLMAEVLIVTLFFTQALKYWYKSQRAIRWLNILMIFQALAVLATFSRAAWIALGVQLILLLVFSERKARQRLLVILAVCLILLSPLTFYMYRLQSEFSIGGSSTANRMIMLEIAWEKFKEKPLFGWGSGQFENFTANDVRFIAKYGAPLDSHGVWQKVLSENGLFGLIIFALLFLSIITLFYRVLRKYSAQSGLLLSIFLGSIGMFAIQFFNTSYYKGKLWLPIALGLAAINIVRKEVREAKKKIS